MTYGIGCERLGTGATYRANYFIVIDGERQTDDFTTCEEARQACIAHRNESEREV